MPWKYGFKSIKSIVKIKLRRKAAADQLEQAEPQRIRLLLERESRRRSSALEPGDRTAHRRRRLLRQRHPTLMFNGYADQVASLYAGMDLRKFF